MKRLSALIKKLTVVLGVIFSLSLIGCITYYNTPALSLREKYVNSNQNLSQEVSHAIIEGRVIKGMTTENVLASWGKPNSISYHEGEWWYYNRPSLSFAPKKVVGFDKAGIVTDITEFHWYDP